MTKIVVNNCFGGFGLSEEAKKRLDELSGIDGYLIARDNRTDPILIKVVEELGESANGEYAELKIIEIPDDVKWYMTDYDGIETIREGRSW